MYAAGRRPETPFEPKKPLACGEAVMTTLFLEVVERRSEVREGSGLK